MGRLWFAGFAAASAVLALIPYVSAAAAALVIFALHPGQRLAARGPAAARCSPSRWRRWSGS